MVELDLSRLSLEERERMEAILHVADTELQLFAESQPDFSAFDAQRALNRQTNAEMLDIPVAAYGALVISCRTNDELDSTVMMALKTSTPLAIQQQAEAQYRRISHIVQEEQMNARTGQVHIEFEEPSFMDEVSLYYFLHQTTPPPDAE